MQHSNLHTHTHIFFFRFFSLMGHYKILSMGPCATQWSLWVIYLIHSNVYMLISSFWFNVNVLGFPKTLNLDSFLNPTPDFYEGEDEQNRRRAKPWFESEICLSLFRSYLWAFSMSEASSVPTRTQHWNRTGHILALQEFTLKRVEDKHKMMTLDGD